MRKKKQSGKTVLNLRSDLCLSLKGINDLTDITRRRHCSTASPMKWVLLFSLEYGEREQGADLSEITQLGRDRIQTGIWQGGRAGIIALSASGERQVSFKK